MKKLFLLLAVASLALISCNKDENGDTQSQQQTITLHASVDLSNLGTRVTPNASELAGPGDVNFHWEAGDQVTISNNSESSTFTVKASTISGNSADFEGTALSDMSSYTVSYNENATTVAYASGTFKPVCSGTGSNTNFSIDTFQPVIKLQLTGSVTLGKIEYWTGTTPALTTTLTFSEGLTLTSTAQTVYFPVTAASTNGLTFKFYDNATTPELIMEKTTSSDVVGKITTFPVLEVKSVLLPGKFTVASGKQVQFTNGNLYYSTTDNAYHIEDAQYVTYATLGQSSYTATHVCHFFWSNITDWQTTDKQPWASSYSYSSYSPSDEFFCGETHKMTVDGQSGLYALSKDEWIYLLNTSGATSGARTGNRFAKANVNGVNGLIIFPDGYTTVPSDAGIATVNTTSADFPSSSIAAGTWTSMESAGCVFLPAAGERDGSILDSGGSYGIYWSATPSVSGVSYACLLYFYSNRVIHSSDSSRKYGDSVRLVK